MPDTFVKYMQCKINFCMMISYKKIKRCKQCNYLVAVYYMIYLNISGSFLEYMLQ